MSVAYSWLFPHVPHNSETQLRMDKAEYLHIGNSRGLKELKVLFTRFAGTFHVWLFWGNRLAVKYHMDNLRWVTEDKRKLIVSLVIN